MKGNIRPLNYGLKEVLAIRPVRFDWTKNSQSDIGFVAQDIERVVPEVVGGGPGMRSIGYSGLVPVLVQAIKEQQKDIEGLRQEINRLKGTK